MKRLLPCPRCSKQLWVEIGTAGGHHTEAWPAHRCGEVPAQASAPAPVPQAERGKSLQLCTACGELPIVGDLEQGAKYCDPCRAANAKRAVARWQARKREEKQAARRCAGCGGSLEGRHPLARRCLSCKSADELARAHRQAGRTCACGRPSGKAERCLVCIAAEMVQAKQQRVQPRFHQQEVA